MPKALVGDCVVMPLLDLDGGLVKTNRVLQMITASGLSIVSVFLKKEHM